MLGAIIGDIVGSRFERHNIKTKEFEFLNRGCRITDDSVMTLAVARAVFEARGDWDNLGERAVRCMREVGRLYPNCGYGGHFGRWLFAENPQPYNSFGNGAAMRVSACGWAAKTLDEARLLSRKVTEITHNHPEGLKGAEAVAVSVFLARAGKNCTEIGQFVEENYYPLRFELDEIRERYTFDVSCQGSVPQAIKAFLESNSFEEAVRNAVSIGGDSDTLAAIAGSIAEARYGIPCEMRTKVLTYLDDGLIKILEDFESVYMDGHVL